MPQGEQRDDVKQQQGGQSRPADAQIDGLGAERRHVDDERHIIDDRHHVGCGGHDEQQLPPWQLGQPFEDQQHDWRGRKDRPQRGDVQCAAQRSAQQEPDQAGEHDQRAAATGIVHMVPRHDETQRQSCKRVELLSDGEEQG
ncbi:hypothetical protein [Bifidobacterium ruminantium]|uniref:hypothetical protein n=1 Tax=Bifidobacterium ruminantium TaxID=78346 RepID=UPI001ED99F31|nr:hypothetical protein [Bifidobacterium ruminantium]